MCVCVCVCVVCECVCVVCVWYVCVCGMCVVCVCVWCAHNMFALPQPYTCVYCCLNAPSCLIYFMRSDRDSHCTWHSLLFAQKGGRRQPASRGCVRVLTPYPEPDWNQGERWSPLGQPHPLMLVPIRSAPSLDPGPH